MSETTPIAELLYQWMWRQIPPMIHASQLAARLGVSRQAVANWLSGNSVPRPAILYVIHERTMIPLAELFAAAGLEYGSREAPPLAADTVFDYLTRQAKTLPENAREEVTTFLERSYQQYIADQRAPYDTHPQPAPQPPSESSSCEPAESNT